MHSVFVSVSGGVVRSRILADHICLDWVFVSGSAMLGISIGLNAVSTHGACEAIFVAIAAIAAFGLASIRTLGRITWLAWIGLAGIVIASRSSMVAPFE